MKEEKEEEKVKRRKSRKGDDKVEKKEKEKEKVKDREAKEKKKSKRKSKTIDKLQEVHKTEIKDEEKPQDRESSEETKKKRHSTKRRESVKLRRQTTLKEGSGEKAEFIVDISGEKKKEKKQKREKIKRSKSEKVNKISTLRASGNNVNFVEPIKPLEKGDKEEKKEKHKKEKNIDESKEENTREIDIKDEEQKVENETPQKNDNKENQIEEKDKNENIAIEVPAVEAKEKIEEKVENEEVQQKDDIKKEEEVEKKEITEVIEEKKEDVKQEENVQIKEVILPTELPKVINDDEDDGDNDQDNDGDDEDNDVDDYDESDEEEGVVKTPKSAKSEKKVVETHGAETPIIEVKESSPVESEKNDVNHEKKEEEKIEELQAIVESTKDEPQIVVNYEELKIIKDQLGQAKNTSNEIQQKYDAQVEVNHKLSKTLEDLEKKIETQKNQFENQLKLVELFTSIFKDSTDYSEIVGKFVHHYSNNLIVSNFQTDIDDFNFLHSISTPTAGENIEETKEADNEDDEVEDDLYFTKPPAMKVTYDDKWTKKTAGGCFNCSSWWKNPQYLLFVDETRDVTIRLTQTKNEHIGFYVLTGNSFHKRSILKEDLVEKCSFEDSPEVSKTVRLEASKDPYIVIPANYDADITGNYSIIAESNRPIIFHKLVKSLDWNEINFKDQWQGKYAAGCRNYPNHLDNHQYLVTSKYKTFIRLLLQFSNKENVDDVGIYVVSYSDEEESVFSKIVNLQKANIVHKSGFNRPNEAIVSFTVNPNEKLVIIPSTFEPNKEAFYNLIVFSDKEISIRKLEEPKRVSIESQWDPSDNSMGGCLNHPSWRYNPQFGLTFDSNVQIKLTQKNNLDTPHAIGFYLLKSDGGRILEVTKENFISKASFTSSPSVICNLNVEKLSTFTIVPCTFRPNKQSKFELEVFSNNTNAIVELDFARSDWVESVVSGEWKGRSAGGCFNHHTWRSNPQIRLVAEKSGEVVLVLEQQSHDQSATNDVVSIGFYITKKPIDNDIIFTDSQEDILKKAAFKKTSSLSCKFDVEAGMEYNVIPCTFTPFDEATFKMFAYGYQQSLTFHSIIEDPEIANNRTVEGRWSEQTSGGCMKNQTWPNNPKFYLISHPTMPTPVEIILVQETNKNNSSDVKYHPVGLSVCHCDENGLPKISSIEDIIFNSNYEESREISISVVLPPSTSPFVITPSTFEPNQFGQFNIQVYSSLSKPVILSSSYLEIIKAINEANDTDDEEVDYNPDIIQILASENTPEHTTDITSSNENNNNNKNHDQIQEDKNIHNNAPGVKSNVPPPPPLPSNIPAPPPMPSNDLLRLVKLNSSGDTFNNKIGKKLSDGRFSPSPRTPRNDLLSSIKKVSLKDHSIRPVPEKETLPQMTWTPFNIDKIVARRAVLEHIDDDEGDTEEWYDDGDWD